MATLTISDAARVTGVSRMLLYRYIKSGVRMHGVTKSMFTPGYLYWIQMEETCYVKIGVALDVRARLRELQIGCPFDLKIIRTTSVANMYYAEQEAHGHYKEYRMRGEWFLFPGEMLSPNSLYAHKHLRLSELKRKIALLCERIQCLEMENASLKQQIK